MWLTGQLTPDFKTIADFRRDNGPAIRKVCARFIALCRGIHLLDSHAVAIDGSKFKAVNHREKNCERQPTCYVTPRNRAISRNSSPACGC